MKVTILYTDDMRVDMDALMVDYSSAYWFLAHEKGVGRHLIPMSNIRDVIFPVEVKKEGGKDEAQQSAT